MSEISTGGSTTSTGGLKGLVVIDEIQRAPDLFAPLRVLADREDNACKFLILGSASRDLIRQGSETLAGRIAFLEIPPFSGHEFDSGAAEKLWLRGGFPRSFLAESDDLSWEWRRQYIRTFLERDIPQLGIRIPAQSIRRLWLMLSHYHGQVLNSSELGKSLGISDTTASHYVDLLAGTFMVRRLSPWHANTKKRQVKRPKIYFRDSGVLHFLAGIPSMEALLTNPKLGASWEGFALEETIRRHQASVEEVYFWRVHGQAELDLLITKDGRRLGFEFKYGDAPKLSRSMRQAFEILDLDELQVVYPGEQDYALADKITVRGLSGENP